MLVKYDSTFKACWAIEYEYITFDDNNGLATDGQNLFWVFNDFTSGVYSLRIIKCAHDGQILSDIPGPLANSFFPAINYAVDPTGHQVLVINIYSRMYLYRYDPGFHITWQDSIQTSTSGFPFNHGLTCVDSSFYFTADFMTNPLMIGHFTLLNVNAGANYPSDIFVAKWGFPLPVSITGFEENNNPVQVFPNPVSDEMKIENMTLQGGEEINIVDAIGHVVYSEPLKALSLKIQLLNLPGGVYFLQVMNKEHVAIVQTKFVIM